MCYMDERTHRADGLGVLGEREEEDVDGPVQLARADARQRTAGTGRTQSACASMNNRSFTSEKRFSEVNGSSGRGTCG